MCALGWQSFVPGASNVGASQIQAFAVLASDSYVPKPWHIATLTVLICSCAILFNVFLARKLPGIEAAVFTLYILAFIAFFIILLAMGPRSGAKPMFTHFEDNAGWGSIGTACFVGVSGPVITLIGSDSAVHMAEELKDASRQLPKAMLSTAAVNYLLGFLMLIAFIAVVGDVDSVLQTTTGQPYVQVIWNATQSRVSAMVMVAFIIFFFIFCAVNQNTTSSRQLYAFARDGGLPCSRWVSHVSVILLPRPNMFTDDLSGLSNQEHPDECRLLDMADRERTCTYPPWLDRRICQHSNNRQFRTSGFLHHLHRLPNAPSYHRWTLWQPSKTSSILPRQGPWKRHQHSRRPIPHLLLNLGYVPCRTQPNDRVDELRLSRIGSYSRDCSYFVHLAEEDLPRSRCWKLR
jgi:Amino acid permease